MGKRLLFREKIEAAKRPRYDYFEDQDVVALQDKHLLRVQRHWSSYRASFELPDPFSNEREDFRRELSTLVGQRMRRQTLWVVKDPRTAIFLEDWITVLQERRIIPKLLIVHRDAESNIRSFSSKGQVPELWAEALWQRTYINALEHAHQLPPNQKHFVSFDRLLHTPIEEAQKACDFLNWKTRKDTKKTIQQKLDYSLPTEKPRKGNSSALHHTTKAIETFLNASQTINKKTSMHPLIADQINQSVSTGREFLQLNRVSQSGQTVLPKSTISIITAELQGWNGGGGIGSAYYELAIALAQSGHQVQVLLVSNNVHSPQETPARVTVESLDPSGLTSLQLCRKVARHVKNHGSDVIHMHDWLGLGSGIKEILGEGGPTLIVGIHGPSAWTRSHNRWPTAEDGSMQVSTESLYAEGLKQALEKDLITSADILVSPSQFMANWVKNNLLGDVATDNLVVQRNCPLSRDRIHITNKNHAKTQQVLIYFGRMEERKGFLLFLDAIKEMEKKPIEVIFIGGDCIIQETRQASEIATEQLSRLGVPHQFHTNLQRSEALNMLKELQGVIAIPSLTENSPCVIEELLDSGLQVVTTDAGGTKELIDHDSHAWLSNVDTTEFANHLQNALRNPNTDQYRLRSRVPGWQITLSWQAFHERLARPASFVEASKQNSCLVKRCIRYAKRTAAKISRKLLSRGK